MSSFYESADFNNLGDVVESSKNSAEKISFNKNISNDGRSEIPPVADLENQVAKDVSKEDIIGEHPTNVLADAIRTIMDKDN